MEASRLNIAREKPPTMVLINKANGFANGLVGSIPLDIEFDVGDKGQLDVELEVVGQRFEMDENDNEIIKYVLRVVKASKLDATKVRI